MSLITANRNLVEEPQQISHPVLLRRHLCCWGGTFFLKTPLEHIPKYSQILIEFYNRKASDNPRRQSLFQAKSASFDSSSSDHSSPAAYTLLSDLVTESISAPAADRTEISSHGPSKGDRSRTVSEEKRSKWKIGICRLSLDMLTTQFDLRVAVTRPDAGEAPAPADNTAISTVSMDISVYLR